jgi:thiol-disulfide isomerase/thioredoxin
MKNKLTIILKVLLSLVSFIGTYFLLEYLFLDLVKVHDLYNLNWFSILVCFIGFYFSGLITKSVPLKLIPILSIQLLLFYNLGKFYFPFNVVLIVFASFGIILARKELKKQLKTALSLISLIIFTFALLSQPLIIEKKYFGKNLQGDYINAKLIWDFSNDVKSLPDLNFYNAQNEKVDLSKFQGKKVIITFWATWCGPCLAEKPELEKLKTRYENDPNIVFIDVSFDSDYEKWISYIDNKNPKGIQLVSNNIAKDKASLGISAIPFRILTDKESNYRDCLRLKELSQLLTQNDSVYEAYIKQRKRFIDYTPSGKEIEQMERLLNE